jgi:type II secretory pathway pseudopilin PulG
MVALTFHKKLKASTIIEVVVALVIIMIVFGIATMTYVRLIHSDNSPKLKLNQQLATLASEAVNTGAPLANTSHTLEHDVTVHQQVLPYEHNTQLVILELEAVDRNEQQLSIYRELVWRPADETD